MLEKREALKSVVVILTCFLFLDIFIENIEYLEEKIDYVFHGETILCEGDFVVVGKNDEIGPFWTSEKSFVLESDTKERYLVYVLDVVYNSYFVNDKIKATFKKYSRLDTCNDLEVESIIVE